MFIFCSCSDKEDKTSSVKNRKSGEYKLSVSFDILSNNSVGNEWDCFFTYEGEQFTDSILFDSSEKGKIAEILVVIRENDKYPDIKKTKISVPILHNEMKSKKITVTENKGRFKGNSAVWIVSVSVKEI